MATKKNMRISYPSSEKIYVPGEIMPIAVDEAAYIDGCTKIQTFGKIVLPMSKPIITYCAVSQFTPKPIQIMFL